MPAVKVFLLLCWKQCVASRSVQWETTLFCEIWENYSGHIVALLNKKRISKHKITIKKKRTSENVSGKEDYHNGTGERAPRTSDGNAAVIQWHTSRQYLLTKYLCQACYCFCRYRDEKQCFLPLKSSEFRDTDKLYYHKIRMYWKNYDRSVYCWLVIK